jgi:hypothetical protein
MCHASAGPACIVPSTRHSGGDADGAAREAAENDRIRGAGFRNVWSFCAIKDGNVQSC